MCPQNKRVYLTREFVNNVEDLATRVYRFSSKDERVGLFDKLECYDRAMAIYKACKVNDGERDERGRLGNYFPI